MQTIAPASSSLPQRLFTPGPLSTTATVKAAMLVDLGSRDPFFLRTVAELRTELLAIAQVSEPEFAAVPIQGSGTFAVEATLGSAVGKTGGLLILSNGAYGDRLADIARSVGIPHVVHRFAETEPLDPHVIATAQRKAPHLSHLAFVHCETSTGQINNIDEVSITARAAGLSVICDAMSSFGAIATPLDRLPIDFLVTSPNKCLQGVPGCGLVLLRRSALRKGQAHSMSLDLWAQLDGLDRSGQFRFTPPTHVLLALRQALRELADEGGQEQRRARYQANSNLLADGMAKLGFRTLLPKAAQSPIISAFYYPDDARFDFAAFYRSLGERGLVIYPGKVSHAACFRIGTIGDLYPDDIRELLTAIPLVLSTQGISVPLSATPSEPRSC
ncbi:MAG TPA: 2-aminoethylphosphonate--pyruvate transaminase [Pseudomonadota bacterium]|nr:2-aminoethylphosphonate--pyruvate transaminase [Pseudomonadota bacterium]